MRRRIALTCLAGALVAAVTAAPASAGINPENFPGDFLWGTATAGFQVEAGGKPANVDKRSDWYAFTEKEALADEGVVSGDSIARGPGFWQTWKSDLDRAAERLDNNAIRLGIEWSRIFPKSTAKVKTGNKVSKAELKELHELADEDAVKRYRQIFAGARDRGLEVMATLNHFTLPIWIHDPLGVREEFEGRGPDDPVPSGLRKAGWLQSSTVDEFRKYAAYVAWKLGGDVDLYATVNEPLVTVSQGFVSIPGVTGVKAPAVLSYPAALRAVENLALANAAAYDAVHDQDGRADVGFVHNMVDWRPSDPSKPEDATAAAHADQIFNRTFIEAAVRGWYDSNANGTEDEGELREGLRDKADFIGVNHYSPGRAQALGAPVSPNVPLFDFLPQITYRGHGNPEGPPCPTTCSDFGWEIDPAGLRNVVAEAASYGKPVYVTENGIDDAEDDQRPAYLRAYLGALQDAIAEGMDVRGYFHWSLLDNYEWAEGYSAHFGLYSYDPKTLKRTERPSAQLYAEIARTGAIP